MHVQSGWKINVQRLYNVWQVLYEELAFSWTYALGLLISGHQLWTPTMCCSSPALLESSLHTWKSYWLLANLLHNISLLASPYRIYQSASVDSETTTFVGGLQLNKILKIRCNAMGAFWLESKHACCKHLMQAINMTVLWFVPFLPWENVSTREYLGFFTFSSFSFNCLFSFVEADFVRRSLLPTCFVFNSVDFKVLSCFFASLCNFKTSFLRSLLILLKNTVNMKMSLLKTVPYYDK